MIDRTIVQKQIPKTLERTDLGMGERVEGKVRDNYLTGDGRRFIVVTDRLSAFDRVITTLPFKGQVLNRAAAFWFDLTRDQVPNHMLRVPDPCVMEVTECAIFPVEMVVRSYLTGVTSTAIWTHYSRGKRVFCGHKLPDGLKKNEPLPGPILTPSTKAAHGGHDISAAREELLDMGVITAKDFDALASLSMTLFSIGQAHCAKNGVILVDTKYEFGRTPDGRIVVADEVHTPDSSRFWLAETYEARLRKGEEPEGFDKEYVRRWLADQGFTGDGRIPHIPDDVRVEAAMRYILALEKITGLPFEPDTVDPLPRIRRNLSSSRPG